MAGAQPSNFFTCSWITGQPDAADRLITSHMPATRISRHLLTRSASNATGSFTCAVDDPAEASRSVKVLSSSHLKPTRLPSHEGPLFSSMLLASPLQVVKNNSEGRQGRLASRSRACEFRTEDTAHRVWESSKVRKTVLLLDQPGHGNFVLVGCSLA